MRWLGLSDISCHLVMVAKDSYEEFIDYPYLMSNDTRDAINVVERIPKVLPSVGSVNPSENSLIMPEIDRRVYHPRLTNIAILVGVCPTVSVGYRLIYVDDDCCSFTTINHYF